MKHLSDIPLSVLDLAPIREGGTAADAFRNALDLARHAERWGYKRYWVAEHHNIPGIASAATAVVIGHIAGGTSRIRVGVGRHHAAEPRAAGDRRAVRHARVALPGPDRPGPGPRPRRRPADRPALAPQAGQQRRHLPPGPAGVAVLLPPRGPRAGGPGDPRAKG